MGWNTYANRGSNLEQLVSVANTQYLSRELARIDKIPTPSNVQGGYYKDKSTVDFTGVLKGGKAIAFDCKETALKNLPLKNIHPHQIEYMKDITNLGGHAFIIIHFKSIDQYFRLSFDTLLGFWTSWKKENGRASIPMDAPMVKVAKEDKIVLHYLKDLI